MAGAAQKRPSYRFGPFELNMGEDALLRNGTRVKVQDLPYRLLVMLVERPGEIVTREEVQRRLWPENTFVEFDNSLGVAIRKVRDALDDDVDTPRYVETLPRRGYRFVAPVTVLGADPSVPSKPVEAISRAWTGAIAGDTAEKATGGGRSQRYWVSAGLVLVLVGSAVYGFRSLPRHSSATAAAGASVSTIRARRSVAVLGFRNLPGRTQDDWLSPAFAEMLNTELAAGGGLRMISGEDVARAKRELPITDVDSLAKPTLDRLRKNAGADIVVLGSYTLLPNNGANRIRLDVRLQDTQRGETIAEESVTGDENNLFELANQAGGKLRQSLGVSSISAEATSAARASIPSNQEAVRLYTEGQTKLWAFDYIHARELLLKAVAADPKFPRAHSSLSEAWEHLGYNVQSRAEAEQALNLSQHLSEEERLLIEGQYRAALQDRPKAVEVYRKLFNAFPDSLDYGLRLAAAQRWVNPGDSLRTLTTLRSLPPPAGEDPRIDLNEASSWIGQDLGKAKAAAMRAIAAGNALGSHFLVGRAYGVLCEIGAGVGSAAEAISDCENAKQGYAAGGDRNNEARTISDEAILYYQRGDLVHAELMFRDAAKVFREVGDTEGLAATSNNRGDIYLLQGKLDEAKKLLLEAVPNYQAIGDKVGVALVLNDLGDLSRWRGDLTTAETTYQQAEATARELDDKNAIAYVLTGMGNVLTDRGNLAAARKSYEESLALRKQAGAKQNVAETQVALAQLEIEEGHAPDAEALARASRQQFHDEQQSDDELEASAVLVRALLAENKIAEAGKEVAAERPLAAKSQNRRVSLQIALAAAQVVLASDRPESAGIDLEAVRKDARAHGFVGVELETELFLAELSRKRRRMGAAIEELNSLEKRAREKGFGLLARKAAAAHPGLTL